jgi:hypothetical protein
MKVSLAIVTMLVMVLSFVPEGYSQQQTESSTASPNPTGQRNGPAGPPLAQRSSTIRIIGSPTNQPFQGRQIECTPEEQGIAGLIIGPTDLCDR